MALQLLPVLISCILGFKSISAGETDAYEVEDEVVLAYTGQQKNSIDVTHLMLGSVITGLAGIILFLIYSHGKNIEHDNDVSDLQDSVQNMQVHYQEEIRCLEEAHKQKVQNYIKDHREKMDNLQREKDSLNIRIQELQNRIMLSSERYAEVEGQLKESEAEQRAEVRKLQKKHQDLEYEISVLKQSENDLMKQVQQLQSGRECLESEHKKALEEVKLALSQLQSAYEKSQQSLADTKRKSKEADSERNIEVSKLEYQLKELRRKEKDLECSLHVKEEICKSKEQERVTLEHRLALLEKNTLSPLRNQKKKLEEEISNISKINETLEEQVKNKTYEEELQSDKIKRKEEEINELKQLVSKLEIQLLEAKSAHEADVERFQSKLQEQVTVLGFNISRFTNRRERDQALGYDKKDEHEKASEKFRKDDTSLNTRSPDESQDTYLTI